MVCIGVYKSRVQRDIELCDNEPQPLSRAAGPCEPLGGRPASRPAARPSPSAPASIHSAPLPCTPGLATPLAACAVTTQLPVRGGGSSHQQVAQRVSAEYHEYQSDTPLILPSVSDTPSEYHPSISRVSAEYQPSIIRVSDEYHTSIREVSDEYQDTDTHLILV